MSDKQQEETTVIEPITASADGTRNAYTLGCGIRGVSMNYAACLWRQTVLATPNVKTPADWTPCAQAAKCGQCVAMTMREEELLAGKSIYFQSRSVIQKLASAARKWLMPEFGSKSAGMAPREIPLVRASSGTGKSMLDAMGDMGSLADAVTAAASEKPVMAPLETPKPIPVAMPVAQAGESPLQMARRMAAERAKA